MPRWLSMPETHTAITGTEKQQLLQLARVSIGTHWHPELQQEILAIEQSLVHIAHPQACFVTLHIDGRLRGCIGTMEATMNLPSAICHYARAAAFEDPRFYPLDVLEWPAVAISITLLGPLHPIPAESRATILSRLITDRSGLYLKDAHHSATFLPMVWQQLPEPTQFLDALLEKGRWTPGIWPEHIQAWLYSGEEFSE